MTLDENKVFSIDYMVSRRVPVAKELPRAHLLRLIREDLEYLDISCELGGEHYRPYFNHYKSALRGALRESA